VKKWMSGYISLKINERRADFDLDAFVEKPPTQSVLSCATAAIGMFTGNAKSLAVEKEK